RGPFLFEGLRIFRRVGEFAVLRRGKARGGDRSSLSDHTRLQAFQIPLPDRSLRHQPDSRGNVSVCQNHGRVDQSRKERYAVVAGFEWPRGRSPSDSFTAPSINHFYSARGVVFSSTAQGREQGRNPAWQ